MRLIHHRKIIIIFFHSLGLASSWKKTCGVELAKEEAGTVNWYGLKEDEGSYSVFDTFNDEAGRDAHLNGEIAKALMAKASELFANPPQIHKINILADK